MGNYVHACYRPHRIIKSVEFGGQVKSSESVKAESSSKSLEVLLLEKSRGTYIRTSLDIDQYG